MSDNPFDAPSNAVRDEDEEFDRLIAKQWMNRTWSLFATAVGLTVLQCFCNPFGIISLLALVSSFGAAVRGFSVPAPVKPYTNGMNLIAAIGGIVLLLPAVSLIGLNIVALLAR